MIAYNPYAGAVHTVLGIIASENDKDNTKNAKEQECETVWEMKNFSSKTMIFIDILYAVICFLPIVAEVVYVFFVSDAFLVAMFEGLIFAAMPTAILAKALRSGLDFFTMKEVKKGE